MSERITWTNSTRKLRDLIPWAINPAFIGKDEARRLEESLDQFGQVQAIAISPTNEIYDGHQRQAVWGASKKFGMDYEVDVRVSSRPLTEDERKKLVIYLRKGAVGQFDFDILANNWEFDELVAWGFDEKELLGAGFEQDEPEGEDPGAQVDKAEELRQKWGVEPGQLWKLGEHRLICGDCTDKAVVEKVMGGESVDLVLTDPPYGVSVVADNGKIGAGNLAENHTYSPIVGDDTTDTAKKFYQTMTMLEAKEFIVWGGNYFTEFLPASPCWLIWDKREGMTSNNFADCEIAWTSFNKPSRIYHHLWNGMIRKGNDGEKVHPTQKPSELHDDILKDFSNKDHVIFDGFLGSGTTLIACERLSRKCRAVEISPAYCAVAIQRWVDMTGGVPELITAN